MVQKSNVEIISTKNILAATKDFYQTICHSCNQISILGNSYCIYCCKHLCNSFKISKEEPITCQNCKLILTCTLDNIYLKLNGNYCFILCPLCKKITEANEIITHFNNCPFTKLNKKRLLLIKFFNKCKFKELNKSPFEFKLQYPRSFNRTKLAFLNQKASRNIQIKMTHDSIKSLNGMMKLPLLNINIFKIEFNSSFLYSNDIVCKIFLKFIDSSNKNMILIINGGWHSDYFPSFNIQTELLAL